MRREPIRLMLTVPAGPVAVEDVLPILRGLSNLFTERAVARVEADGRAISCRAGCGACCRQLVPLAEDEGRALAHLVDAMPEPRQSRIRQRFEDAPQRLAEGGLLDRMNQPVDGSGRRALGLDYFRLNIARPFLEDEASSIHPDRPSNCRDYLVTSPAQNCATPSRR